MWERVMSKLAPVKRTGIKTAVDQIGDFWSLLIVWEALHGTSRFDGFQNRLGIARNILSDRLSKLIDVGVLVKQPIRDGARRREYCLTQKGEALRPVLELLERWTTDAPIHEAPINGSSRRLFDQRHQRLSDPSSVGKPRFVNNLKSVSR
jgi:DNA-binding HxlR family transcriptional regulator